MKQGLLPYNILSAMKSLVLPAALSAARPKRLAGLREARRQLAVLAAASP